MVMEKLYLETNSEYVPIDQAFIEKYNLEKGTLSPFTNSRIVGHNGDFHREPHKEDIESKEVREKGFPDDGIDQMDNGFELSTSEMIDIAQGVDSNY